MNIKIEISPGEFLDRLTILRIKKGKIADPVKLANINRELTNLEGRLSQSGLSITLVEDEVDELTEVNLALWEIEDKIRLKEAAKEFDGEFVELARSVYINNDNRSKIKRIINEKSGATFIEEKIYSKY